MSKSKDVFNSHCDSMQEVKYRSTNNDIGPNPATNFHHTGNKLLTSADGTQIYAEAMGRVPGPGVPTIVFIHGLLMSLTVFDTIFADDAWSCNAYLVRYDVRGQGRSGHPVMKRLGVEALRGDFEAVVNAFNWTGRSWLVGKSLGATSITDVLSFHPPEYLSGIIYIAPIPYVAIVYKIASPAVVACVPRLFQPTSVPAFQSAAQSFVSMCSGTGHAFSFVLYRMCLGNAMVQPVETTERIMSRTQDETGLLRAGREGRLPLLFLYGTQDEATNMNLYSMQSQVGCGWTRGR
ncbi:Alpha/Beta hydrolase protein [Infundibulicybe gibba]|nr:Alpha/Beta hydrolase protein [Infundibulicybe gibba]